MSRVEKALRQSSSSLHYGSHLDPNLRRMKQCLTDDEAFSDSDVETVENSGRITPIPPAIFSDEELTEYQDGCKCAKKRTKVGKVEKKLMTPEMTEYEYISGSECNSDEEDCWDFDLGKMTPNINEILYKENDKDPYDSSDESLSVVTGTELKISSGGISGVSDLELASGCEGEPAKNKKSKSKRNRKKSTCTETERKQKPCLERSKNSERENFVHLTLIKSQLSGATATPESKAMTDEEELMDSSGSEKESETNPQRMMTPDDVGMMPEKIRRRESEPKAVPKIVVSYINNGHKPTAGETKQQQTPELEDTTRTTTSGSHAEKEVRPQRECTKKTSSHTRSSRVRKRNEKTLKAVDVGPPTPHEEPSDSENIFLIPKQAEKKKRIKKESRANIVTTDIEELDSDRELEQNFNKDGLTDTEDVQLQSESEAEGNATANADTTAEEVEASSDEEISAAAPSISSLLHEESTVQIQNRINSDWDAPEEAMHVKKYSEEAEVLTDEENLDLPENGPPEKPPRKVKHEFFPNFENVSLTSKSNFCTFVACGGNSRSVKKGLCGKKKEEKPWTTEVEEASTAKEWSEKGQSEEYAYETKGILSEPEATNEARQPAEKPKSDRVIKTPNDDKSEGVKFYELDDEEEILPNGNEPVPQVTMPTFKKRVHSQRIPQSERAAVTPYEGAYDEKYSSDEENVDYQVCEPEDVTERSNSTITFSEDIYDSDAIDEMLKSQIRKASQVSQESSARSEDMTDESKPSRGILKGRGNKKEDGVSLGPAALDEKPLPVLQKDADKTVSPAEKMAIAGDGKLPETAPSGKDKKSEKGEEILEDVTKSLQSVITDTITVKESSTKGEKELITKPPPSTIPQQIDQITDSSATNKHDFAKSDEKVVVNVTKPLQDILSTNSGVLTEAKSSAEPFRAKTPISDQTTKVADEKPSAAENTSPKNAESGLPSAKVSLKTDSFQTGESSDLEEKAFGKTSGDINRGLEIFSNRISYDPYGTALGADEKDRDEDDEKMKKISRQKLKDEKVTSISGKEPPKEEIPRIEISLTREDAAKRAMELIDDITKTVQDVFPAIATEMTASTKHEDRLQDAYETPDDKKIDSGETAPATATKLTQADHFSKQSHAAPMFDPLKASIKDRPEADAEDSKKAQIKSPEAKETHFSITKREAESPLKTSNEAAEKVSQNTTQETELATKASGVNKTMTATDAVASIAQELPSRLVTGVSQLGETVEKSEQPMTRTEGSAESVKPDEKDHKSKAGVISPSAENIESVVVDVKASETVDILTSEHSDPRTGTDRTSIKETRPGILSDVSLNLDKSSEAKLFDKIGEGEKAPEVRMEKDSISEIPAAVVSERTGDVTEEKEPTGDGSSEPESKPRVIFRIDSEDELLSDAENESIPPPSDPSSPTKKLTEKMKLELKETLEREKMKIEERLSTLKGNIFDISDESLSKTKEIVDERLRKISDIKPPQEVEEPAKKEKSPGPGKEVQIGRFHITPALVEEVVSRSKEHEIAERLKTTRAGEETHEEVEKELPEKLTEADLEEVIRELKKEGLKTDVYLQPEEAEKEEKKERTLKRVERRFERMASETLEKDKEEGISEEKINEKREIEFQRMVSNLSSDEVAEYQKEYLQLWEEGGLSSLTPTEDWESRDPDTPENELDDDSPRKSESFQGWQGTGKPGTPNKSSEPEKFLKSPTSPPKPPKPSDDISPKAQPLTPLDASHVGSSPSEVDHSSGFVSERSDDVPPYSERKKFWEQMSSSQSSENAGEFQRSMIESISSAESVEVDRPKDIEEPDKTSVKMSKQKLETVTPEPRKTPDEGGVVKSLTESYSKKIAAGELIMPAIPRPKSFVSKQSIESEAEQSDTHKIPDSSDTAVVSELEVKLKSRDAGAPITEGAVISGSTELEEHSHKTSAVATEEFKKEMIAQESTNSGAEFIEKFGAEGSAFDNKDFSEGEATVPLKERKKVFEESLHKQSSPVSPVRKSKQERSMSLPAVEPPTNLKMKKKHFEEEMRHETITEHVLSQAQEQFSTEKQKWKTPEVKDAAVVELLAKGIKIAEKMSPEQEPAVAETGIIQALNLKETHLEKSETEGSEKEKTAVVQKPRKKEEETIPSITVTASGKRQPETASIGESEDTQSESDVTPEEARVVDNGDTQWEGSGTHSGSFSPKDDMDYPKEMPETGIGRWVGQEDLSKQSWEKDDLDSSHFKVHTKWERTRSEGTSPKDRYVCTPEEHYPDTVWEVPVQEQLEREEITHDIPIEKQVIIEKDEDEFDDEEEGKVKLTEEEAKDIAEEVLEYIQFEVENRSSFLTDDTEEGPENLTQAQVTDYLRHLTKGKDFDDQDVKLIENILVKKQREQLWKSQSEETAACSLDITDEELRSTGADDDISPVESQITKLQKLDQEDSSDMTLEMSKKDENATEETEDDAQTLKDAEIVDKTLAEVKESLEAAQEQLIEQHKRKTKSEIAKKESLSEFELKGMSYYDRKIPEAIAEQSSAWENLKDFKSEMGTQEKEKQEGVQGVKSSEPEGNDKKTSKESLKEQTLIRKSHEEEFIYSESEKEKLSQRSSKDSSEEEKQLSHQIETTTEMAGVFTSDSKIVEKRDFDKTTKTLEEISKAVEVEGEKTEQTDLHVEDKEVQQIQARETTEKETIKSLNGQRVQTSTAEEAFTGSLRESKKSETTTAGDATTALKISSRLTEVSKTESKIHKAVVSESKMDVEELKTLEISVPDSMVLRKIGEQICSSEDSPRSGSLEESTKSPPGGEEVLSSGSSTDKPGENKSDVLFRHSSSLGFLKADRRSGADLEPYSSSGESHYHSFEQTPSRPCSSDVEVLLAGNIATTGSSEYESAMSQEPSSKQQTSTDYQTAVSSLSSRDSIRSLDSESSGHLGSVEVSSEASETLIPSALELDRDIEAPGTTLADYDGPALGPRGAQRAAHRTEPAPSDASGRPADEDFEIISESEVASTGGGASETEDDVVPEVEEAKEHAQKMKRSYEMTFQPELKPIAFSDSFDGLPKDAYTEKALTGASLDESSSIISAPDEKFGSSLEESASVLSMSLSTTSEPSAMRTVIELSHTDSEKMEGSLTVSATSTDSASREDLDNIAPQTLGLTNEMSTSTVVSSSGRPAASVTMTTSSSSDVHGVPCVSTQVTSVSRKSSMADEIKSESDSHEDDSKSSNLAHANGPTQVEYVPDYDEIDSTKTKKTQGHRRKESTSNFTPTIMWNLSEARTLKVRTDITEMDEEYGSDKYVYDLSLTEKEVKNDEKKEADDSEGHDHGFEGHERKVSEETEEFKDYDSNRSQSQISRTDSDSGRRHVSPVFSEDQPDSELSELMKQGSSETEREDPLERPLSPEPEEMENKDITPELSSEAQASVTELEMEYSGAYSRRDEYASHVSPIREEKLDAGFNKAITEEYLQEDRVPDGLRSQTSLESTVAEKHELETGEKEILQKKPDLPDITVTEHLTPVSGRKFQYPSSKEEAKEKKSVSKTPETPASTSSRTSSSSTDQGKEYNLDEVEIRKMPGEIVAEEKGVSEAKDEKESLDSPSSDSFEMLDKPDITDEFVIIEEVGREAQENDQEGKSIKIATRDKKPPKRIKEEQEVIESPPSPATKMTDLKYYPSEEDSNLFLLDSDSPPQAATRKFEGKLKKKSSKEEKSEEYDQQIEQSKKWMEMQFQGEQAAKIVGAYGYEMEFERAPLEDIKEEDLNELDSSSKMGSMGSQKESLGSLGSVKDSFSSTPDFDVLAGRKYFTRSGDHDDVSMSSLQEFELIEKKLMENGKKSGSSSSQDSLSSKKLGTSSKSGQGDDISTGSLKEFETLENACATVVNMETKAKQEEAILSEIDEGHESQISESESCETVSAVVKEKFEFDSEDFDKKMFDFDEIMRQTQSHVEKFSEMQALEKTESIGRGDSYEEVAKVPDLELDMPLSGKLTTEAPNLKHGKGGFSYSTQSAKKKADDWKAVEETVQQKPGFTSPKQSELLENGGKIKSISADSLEIQAQENKILEGKEETISLDSYKRKTQKPDLSGFAEMTHKSDSLEEMRHHDCSSGEYTSSGTDHRPPPRAEFVLGSTDSLDPSSSTATHATYQYETDSVMSCSFTSGDSNTMISSTDNLDMLPSGQSVIDLSKDLGISKTDDWLENLRIGGANPLQKQASKPRTRSEVHKIEFRGPDAEKAFQEYVQGLGPQEEVIEEEADEHGNIHIKKVLRQRVVIRTGDPKLEHPTTIQHEKVAVGSSQPFISETVENLQDDTYSHVVHKKIQMAPQVEKLTFRGPDAEKALKSYIENLPEGEEVEEIEDVDEHGNIIRRKIIRQRVLIRPGEEVRAQHGMQKVAVPGEDPEKTADAPGDKLKTHVIQKSGGDTSLHIKKILPDQKVTAAEEPNQREAQTYKKQFQDQMEIIDIGPQLQKIIIKGPNAEKTLEDYARSLNPEDDVLEIEETDEHGNVHLKKVLRQRILVRPNKELTKEELQQYLSQLVESESLEGEGYSHVVQKTVDVPAQIEKVTFKGPDAEKQLQEYIRLQQQQQPEIEEIEEVDEHGNVHIKRILKERVVVRPSRELTKAELEEYLNSLEEPEAGEGISRVIQPEVGKSTEVQKITFKGPDAEKQLQEYIRLQQQQQPEIEEIEEVDEHGNVHIKRIMKQRVVIRPGQSDEGFSIKMASDSEGKQSRMLTKDELEQYLDQLEESTSGSPISFRSGAEGGHAKDTALMQKLTQSQELSERLLTEEEFQERLRLGQTTVHTEDIYVGSAEPYVSEIIEPLDEEGFSHIIHRKVQMAPEVQKVVFRGPDADRAMKAYMEALNPGEDIEEVEEVDEHGNVHVKRILRRKIIIRPEDLEKTGLKGEELKAYLQQVELEHFEGGEGPHVHHSDPALSSIPKLTQGLSSTVVLTEKESYLEEEKAKSESPSLVGRKESGISQRPPLVSDISMDDEAEYDPTEHDWRHQLEILHAEADEDEIDRNLDAALAAPYSSHQKQ